MLTLQKVLTGLALSSAMILPLPAAVSCVNPTGANGCVKTIAAAVSAAAAGDTVDVAAGTYTGNITISKSITLVGADPAKTIIDATGLPMGIYVDGIDNANLSGVSISGFTVQNAQFEGILVANASAVTVSGNIVTGNNKGVMIGGGQNGMNACPNIPAFETSEGNDCGEGIHLMGATNSSVLNNTVTNNSGGILVSDDTGATWGNIISGNVVSGNSLACGITLASHVPAALTGSTAPLGVYNNTVTNNQSMQNGLKGEGAGIGIFASAPGCKAYANLVANNTATGNGIPGVAIHGHAPGQVLDGNTIVGNTLSGNGADVADTATPGTAGIALTSVSPVKGTLINGNTISGEMIAVSWNAPGTAQVQRNSFSTYYGVYNLSGAGTVNADANWWGCNNNPASGFAFLSGCSAVAGQVTVGTWLSAAPGK